MCIVTSYRLGKNVEDSVKNCIGGGVVGIYSNRNEYQ